MVVMSFQLGCFKIPHNKHIRWWNNEWLARLLAAMAYQSYYMQQRAVGIMTIMVMIMAELYVSMLAITTTTTAATPVIDSIVALGR